MPLSRLCLLIYLTPTLQPAAACPAHLRTQTARSFADICLAPTSGQAVFQAQDSRAETDNNPSPGGAETLPEARRTPPAAEPRPSPAQPPAGSAGASRSSGLAPPASAPPRPAPCVLLSAHRRLKRARPLPRLRVPGHVASSVKEGPSCPHTLSAEFSPQTPVTAAWKDSSDRGGAGAQWSPRGWAHLGHSGVRVGRHLPVSTRTRRQADQLPSPWAHEGQGSRRSSGPRLPRKDCQLHAPELPVRCLMLRLCGLSSLSGTLPATRLEEPTGIV